MEELSSEALYGADFGAERMWGLKELVLETERFTPQTIAWLWLGAFVIALILIFIWRRYQYWKRQAYRRNALLSLETMKNDFSQLKALPQILRHAALMSAPRAEVIAVSGDSWIAWLNQRAGKTLFNNEDEQLLSQLAYGRNADASPQQSQHLIHATETWVRGSHA